MSGHLSPLVERRVRHVAAIQIANLTPFPARDSLASALTQPSEQPQFTTHGHLSDDLDVTIQRKRSRRISGNSIATHRSMRSEDGLVEEDNLSGTVIARGLKKSTRRVSFPAEGSDLSPSASQPSIRPRRPRTTSTASSHMSIPSHWVSSTSSMVSALPSTFSAISHGYSQAGLEKVIQSRLVETFLVITVPPVTVPAAVHLNHIPQGSPSSKDRTSSPKTPEAKTVRKVVKPSSPVSGDKSAIMFRRGSPNASRISPRSLSSQSRPTATSVPRADGKAKVTSPRPTSALSEKLPSENLTPQYFSPIHRPSTHPHFTIDTHTFHDVDEGRELKVEIWGRVDSGWKHRSMDKGKAKEVLIDSEMEWKILQHWDVDLDDLIPLSETSATSKIHSSSNLLLITLFPPGQTFYLPPPPSTPLRPPSPIGGYASDPESGHWRVKQLDLTSSGDTVISLSRRRQRGGGGPTPLSPSEALKTASWQDLFNLATLQSCILDNQVSSSDVIRGMDVALELDGASVWRREVSEREARLEELIMNHKSVKEDSVKLRNAIDSRLEDLRQRKHLLELAKQRHGEDLEFEREMEEAIGLDRARHSSLRARLGPIRTTLFTVVSTIYPIELLSPPDLLYTVLDVPLPIPLSASDPAPPLTLPSHKDVTEDAVATSLGYAAQAVQLIAAYLGKSLIYPVTYIGSRSLIRDNISAMVGPRMFPLYSKGVDTYRFEYGVFLLNKDIELLMADRELRALDMRHTLPNLKNLLLTLTDGEGADLQPSRIADSPVSLATETRSSSRPDSPVDPNSDTPKASSVLALEEHSPPASGSTTPTAAATDTAKKSRPFLGFSPLADFLRGKYPSTSRISVKSSPGAPEEVQESEERQATSVENANPERDESVGDDINGKLIIPDSLAVSNGEGRKTEPSLSVTLLNGEGEKMDGESHSPAHVSPPLPLTSVR